MVIVEMSHLCTSISCWSIIERKVIFIVALGCVVCLRKRICRCQLRVGHADARKTGRRCGFEHVVKVKFSMSFAQEPSRLYVAAKLHETIARIAMN